MVAYAVSAPLVTTRWCPSFGEDSFFAILVNDFSTESCTDDVNACRRIEMSVSSTCCVIVNTVHRSTWLSTACVMCRTDGIV